MRTILATAALALIPSLSARADLLDGLEAYFPMNEGGGNVIHDQWTGTTANFFGPGWGAYWDGDPRSVYLAKFDNEHFRSVQNIASGVTNQLTITAWIQATRFDDWNGIVTKGVTKAPFTFTVTWARHLRFGANMFTPAGGTGDGVWDSSVLLNGNSGVWQHVAVTYDGSKVRFYIDGVKDPVEHDASVVFGQIDEPLVIGSDLPGNAENFAGAIREVSVYSRALGDTEIASIYSGETPSPAKLSADLGGLWLGKAVLDEVKHAATGEWQPTPAGFPEDVLMFVSGSGNVQLLDEATLMRTRVVPPASPQTVIVLDESQLPNFDGITMRGGKLVGQRFSTATMPIDGSGLTLGTDSGWFEGQMTLPASHPLNPFRHKYHPDLKNGRSMGRTVRVKIDDGESGTDQVLEGDIHEAFTGLNKETLEARGRVTFTRVSTSTSLVQP
ncbi:hypothetical protein HAHE_21700 [Haloferula helveola]|uniref:LamG-like jellyroll fold domain-containing protein n=1 Tax=Haloferula helveola TaxID=490095 RepID=A0ABM7REY1_9BACT|nr:hypothetical protein HAHE_21700 [Haloferula helveola]